MKRGGGRFLILVLATALAASAGFWFLSKKGSLVPPPPAHPSPAAFPKDPADASIRLLEALHQGLSSLDLLKVLDRPVESSLEDVEGRQVRTYRETYRLPRRWTAESLAQALGRDAGKAGARLGECAWREDPEGRLYEASYEFPGGWRPVTLAFLEVRAPRLALVIDDAGYAGSRDLGLLWDLKVPATIAIIPGLEFSTLSATEGHAHGWEVICHMPMEGHEKTPPGAYRWFIQRSIQPEQLSRILEEAIADIPHCDGMNNHMGSRATEEKDLMLQVAHYLRKHGLFFLDSRTTDRTVALETMRSAGVPAIERNVFLDNTEDEDSIRRQLRLAVAKAKKQGYAVAIAHVRTPSLRALLDVLPEAKDAGVKFVYLSELVK